jgi:branched-chain amino acid transport system substrate-binding protein
VSVGVTDSTITLSADGAFSGAYAAIYEQQYRGSALTWRDEVNAKGGINGRKIEFKKVDDRFTVEGAVSACKEIESNGSFAAYAQSLFNSGIACLENARIPLYQTVLQAADPASLGWKYVRAIKDSNGEGATLARFIVSPNGLGRPGHKIGLLYTTDNPVASYVGPFLAEAKRLGMDVHVEKIVTNQSSFVAELQRLRQAGVDTVAMVCVFEAVGILRDAKAIGFNPTWTGHTFTADEVAAGGAELFQGIKAPRTWAGADSPAFQSYKQTVAKYGETTGVTTTNMLGYSALLIMQRALELAGRDLTRESFLAAYDRIQNFDAPGVPLVTYASGRIAGTQASFPLQCCNPDKTWKSIGPASDFRP